MFLGGWGHICIYVYISMQIRKSSSSVIRRAHRACESHVQHYHQSVRGQLASLLCAGHIANVCTDKLIQLIRTAPRACESFLQYSLDARVRCHFWFSGADLRCCCGSARFPGRAICFYSEVTSAAGSAMVSLVGSGGGMLRLICMLSVTACFLSD